MVCSVFCKINQWGEVLGQCYTATPGFTGGFNLIEGFEGLVVFLFPWYLSYCDYGHLIFSFCDYGHHHFSCTVNSKGVICIMINLGDCISTCG